GPRWGEDLRMIHGRDGRPQLAVRSCGSRRAASCRDELWTLTAAAPVKLTARSGGAEAAAAYAGTLDRGRQLLVASRSPCPGRIAVRDADGVRRTLPSLPDDYWAYPHCTQLQQRLITGRYAFAWVYRTNPRLHEEGDVVYGIDLDGGPTARWHFVENDYSGS